MRPDSRLEGDDSCCRKKQDKVVLRPPTSHAKAGSLDNIRYRTNYYMSDKYCRHITIRPGPVGDFDSL